MDIYLEFEMNKIVQDTALTWYNHITWELKVPQFGITHFVELYDDVSEYPDYKFGIVNESGFVCLVLGDGDPVPADKVGFGGVFVKVRLHYPELFFKV